MVSCLENSKCGQLQCGSLEKASLTSDVALMEGMKCVTSQRLQEDYGRADFFSFLA